MSLFFPFAMQFNGVAETEDYLRMAFSCRDAATMRWYIVGLTVAGQLYAANGLRESLEKLLARAKESGEISSFSTELVDLSLSGPPRNIWSWARDKNHVYVPFFLNADKHKNLGQELFDANAPGVLCVTRKGYYKTTNPSKRDCFNALFLD